jgi:hypothetical protein
MAFIKPFQKSPKKFKQKVTEEYRKLFSNNYL